jgi:hypothetical protein
LRGGLPIPGQQIGDAVDRVICDAREDVAQIRLGIDALELSSFDEGDQREAAEHLLDRGADINWVPPWARAWPRIVRGSAAGKPATHHELRV